MPSRTILPPQVFFNSMQSLCSIKLTPPQASDYFGEWPVKAPDDILARTTGRNSGGLSRSGPGASTARRRSQRVSVGSAGGGFGFGRQHGAGDLSQHQRGYKASQGVDDDDDVWDTSDQKYSKHLLGLRPWRVVNEFWADFAKGAVFSVRRYDICCRHAAPRASERERLLYCALLSINHPFLVTVTLSVPVPALPQPWSLSTRS